MTDLQYPIGKFNLEGEITPAQRDQLIKGDLESRVHEIICAVGSHDYN